MSEERDYILVENENGQERELAVEALFDMNDQSYALLRDKEEMSIMRVENEDGEQYLVNIADPEEKASLLDAYQIALEADPEDRQGTVH